jgi:adenine-specific DNA-methyltransferase
MESAKHQLRATDTPTDCADSGGLFYSAMTTQEEKKIRGQYFTPSEIAAYIASFATSEGERLRILDPGCGTGILSAALGEKLAADGKVKAVEFVAYENDPKLLEIADKTYQALVAWLKERGIEMRYTLSGDDFVMANALALHKELPEDQLFDVIISNPPYFKIGKDDPRAMAAANYTNGQPNIYAIFMAVSARLLKQKGEMIFIVPRSFTSGPYFTRFRHTFFSLVRPTDVHVFAARNQAFKKDKVLQENIIVRVIRNTEWEGEVTHIRSSSGSLDLGLSTCITCKATDLVDVDTEQCIVHLPTNEIEKNVIDLFAGWSNRLHDYGIKISTGPIVHFRARDFLSDVKDHSVPLLWLHNVQPMKVVWPLQKRSKHSYFLNTPAAIPLLLPNKDYVLLRRFSSKDEKSRLVAAPYYASEYDVEKVGLENHLNYIYRPNGSLTDDEVTGIAALLNCTLFDTYFRTFNGNTQVSATELRNIPLPPLEDICAIGALIRERGSTSTEAIDTAVHTVLRNSVSLAYSR